MSKQDKPDKDSAKKPRKARAKDAGPGRQSPRTAAAAVQGETAARRKKAAAKPALRVATEGGRRVATGRKAGRTGEDVRLRVIAELAYFLAEQRRAAKADALNDWLQAEKAVDSLLDSLR